MAYRIDGIRIYQKPPDIDKDGVTGGIEGVSKKDQGVMNIVDRGELPETLELLNKDVLNEEKLSSIDFTSNINNFQVAPLVAVDTCCDMGVISKDGRQIVRQILRKLVSVDGLGRRNNVDVAVGKMERDSVRAGMSNLSPEGQKK